MVLGDVFGSGRFVADNYHSWFPKHSSGWGCHPATAATHTASVRGCVQVSALLRLPPQTRVLGLYHKRAPRFGRLERAPNGSGARPEVATPCALWSTSSSSSTACTEGWHSSHSRRREGAWALDDRPGCVRARFVFAVSSARLGKSPERGASKSSQRAFSAGSRGI